MIIVSIPRLKHENFSPPSHHHGQQQQKWSSMLATLQTLRQPIYYKKNLALIVNTILTQLWLMAVLEHCKANTMTLQV